MLLLLSGDKEGGFPVPPIVVPSVLLEGCEYSVIINFLEAQEDPFSHSH